MLQSAEKTEEKYPIARRARYAWKAIPCAFSTTNKNCMVYRPTDRERQRYITYSGPSPVKTFTTLFGVFSLAAAGLQERGSVIRVNATHVDHVKAALALTPGAASVRTSASYTKAQTKATTRSTTERKESQ